MYMYIYVKELVEGFNSIPVLLLRELVEQWMLGDSQGQCVCEGSELCRDLS